MENPNDTPINQNEVLSISEGELYNKISDAFYPILSPLTPEERTNEIQLLLEDFPLTEPPNQDATIKPVLPGLKPKTYRAILKSDLQLFQNVLSVGEQAITSTDETLLLKLGISVTKGLVLSMFNYWRKGIPLSYEQGIILKAVKEAAHPGFTVDFIARWISDKKPLSLDEIKAVLESLKCVYKADGSKVELVKETDGCWASVGI